MKRTTSCFILFAAIVCLKSAAFAQDLSVFDLKLNEVFNIRECNYAPVEIEMLGTGSLLRGRKKVKMYKYAEERPAEGKCFQRVGMNYTITPMTGSPEAKNLPTVTPISDDKVKLVYAGNLKPSIASSEDIWIGIENSKLTGIRFYFPNLKANEIFQILTGKYGKASSIEELYIQNGIGGRKDFYKAQWTFPKLLVTFLSLDTNRIGFDPAPPNDMDRGYISTIGSVTVQYKTSDNKPKDNNPL